MKIPPERRALTFECLPKHLKQGSAAWVYMLMCEHEGFGLMKIGLSSDPLRRISEIGHSIPFQVKHCGVYRVSTRQLAEHLEMRLHEEFQARRTRGEWFSFDFRSAADKAEFRAGCKKYMDGWWENFPISAFKKFSEDRQKAFFAIHGVKGLERKERLRRAKVRTRRAQEELAQYGT